MVRDDLDLADLFAQQCILDVLKESRRLLLAVYHGRDASTWGPQQTAAFSRAIDALDELIALFSRAG
jgi:hypothetical protein